MNIRKLLANSDTDLWGWCLLPAAFGTIILVVSWPLWLMSSLPMIWKIVGALGHAGFTILYVYSSFAAISMASPYARPCLFKRGDIVTDRHYYIPYLVLESHKSTPWAMRLGGTEEKLVDGNNWRFYESTRFERLLQNKLERLIASGIPYGLAGEVCRGLMSEEQARKKSTPSPSPHNHNERSTE